MNDLERTCAVNEGATYDRGNQWEGKARSWIRQPGDGTRYTLFAFYAPDGKGANGAGDLGSVSKDAVFIISGMGRMAYLFQIGDAVSEDYVAEKLKLTNAHTIHHITALVAEAISGAVVGCQHTVRK